jgi:hypothetical protein
MLHPLLVGMAVTAMAAVLINAISNSWWLEAAYSGIR